jgi:predicted Zn-dependent protease
MIAPQELIERITAAADYEDCIVIVQAKTQANMRWASSTLTTNGVTAEQSVTVIAFVCVEGGIATGSVSRTSVDLNEIASIAKEASFVARGAGAAEDEAPLMRDTSYGDWNHAHVATGPQVFATFAPDLGNLFKKSKCDSIELFGYAEHNHVTTWIGSKGGLRLRHDQPSGRLEMTGKSHSRTRSTWEGRATRDFNDVNLSGVDAGIRERLDWQARTALKKAGHYKTVVPAGAVADLLAYLLRTSSAQDAAEGRSVYSKKAELGKTRIGEVLSKLPINIYTEPNHKGLESSPFNVATSSSAFSSVFDNGVPQERWNFIQEGKLSGLIAPRSVSAKTGVPYSAGGDNLIMELSGATGDLNSQIAKVESGLLITTLWYIRMVDPVTNLLTGLTRDGVYEIRGGEVVGVVNNFRWNESPVELLSRISSTGGSEITTTREVEELARTQAPTVIFEDFNMSTESQAN